MTVAEAEAEIAVLRAENATLARELVFAVRIEAAATPDDPFAERVRAVAEAIGEGLFHREIELRRRAADVRPEPDRRPGSDRRGRAGVCAPSCA